MITRIDSPVATKALGNSYPKQAAKNTAAVANLADQITISKDAKQRLLGDEGATVTSTGAYRVSGQVYRFSEMLEVPGKALVAIKMSDEQIAEGRLHDQQVAAREQANFSYAQSHKYQPVGQVFVNGERVATVLEGGGYELSSAIPGLSEATLSPQERLTEIARAVDGKISYSDFVAMDSWSGPAAPEAMLQLSQPQVCFHIR